MPVVQNSMEPCFLGWRLHEHNDDIEKKIQSLHASRPLTHLFEHLSISLVFILTFVFLNKNKCFCQIHRKFTAMLSNSKCCSHSQPLFPLTQIALLVFLSSSFSIICTSLIPCREIGLLYPGNVTASAALPILTCACNCCVSKQWVYGCHCLGFLTCVQTLIFLRHPTAHRGCVNTIRQSALKVGLQWKIPCCTWEPNPHQYCAWRLGPMLYQLSYPPWTLGWPWCCAHSHAPHFRS